MAVEGPYAGIVRDEAVHQIAPSVDFHDVAADGEGRGVGRMVGVRSGRGVGGGGALDHLEVVAVHVDGVAAVVVVVDDDFDDVHVVEDEGVCVLAVDEGVCGCGAG